MITAPACDTATSYFVGEPEPDRGRCSYAVPVNTPWEYDGFLNQHDRDRARECRFKFKARRFTNGQV
jgi:hypothetical protein